LYLVNPFISGRVPLKHSVVLQGYLQGQSGTSDRGLTGRAIFCSAGITLAVTSGSCVRLRFLSTQMRFLDFSVLNRQVLSSVKWRI
jgi:hypothetical protein